MSNPPAVPQALLHLLLPVDARETVSGDLLEEYREARIPALGELRANPYWIQAWQWSTHRAHPSSLFGFNPDTPDETFLRWMFWDNVGGLFFLGVSMLTVSVVSGGIGSTLGLVTARWRPAAIHKS